MTDLSMGSDPAHLPQSLLLAGAGKMGGALLRGWLAVGMPGDRITVADPHLSAAELAEFTSHGVYINPVRSVDEPPSVMVLAIKPQTVTEAAPALAQRIGTETMLVSVVAGKTIADLGRAFPKVKAIARAMPNTPAAVRHGITGVAVNASVSPTQRGTLTALFSAVGHVEWLDHEDLVDAVTAVSGSGPAYVFYLTECLAKAGEGVGLSPEAALRLARATVEGAGALMRAQPTVPPDVLRRNVTSPAGTTAAALDVLMTGDRLGSALTEAVAAARQRAQALSG